MLYGQEQNCIYRIGLPGWWCVTVRGHFLVTRIIKVNVVSRSTTFKR